MNERKSIKLGDYESIKLSDLQSILIVNQKAIEIQIEVERQNEQILDVLKVQAAERSAINKEILEDVENIKSKIEEINKEAFRIQILLGSGLASLILQIIAMFFMKK
jgi:hypothetical protein